MSLSKKITQCEKDIKKCAKKIGNLVGTGFRETEVKSFGVKIHTGMRMAALENDDVNRKNMFGAEPYPKDTVYVDMKDRSGKKIKTASGEVKQKTIHGYYRLSEMEKPVSKIKTPSRARRKAVVYESEDDDAPVSKKTVKKEESEDKVEEKTPAKPIVKKFTLDMGKEGMLAMTGILRMLLMETYEAVQEIESPPIVEDDIKNFLDGKISESGDCNIYQFLVHVEQTVSLATRDKLYNIDTVIFNAVKEYSGNTQIALHISKLYAHFAKVVAIHCSNMCWDNKTLRRVNTKVFSVVRNLEMGFEKHSTISAGTLKKIMEFVHINDERDRLTRELSKLKKEQRSKEAPVKKTPVKAKPSRRKRGVLKPKPAEESDPEPDSSDELSD